MNRASLLLSSYSPFATMVYKDTRSHARTHASLIILCTLLIFFTFNENHSYQWFSRILLRPQTLKLNARAYLNQFRNKHTHIERDVREQIFFLCALRQQKSKRLVQRAFIIYRLKTVDNFECAAGSVGRLLSTRTYLLNCIYICTKTYPRRRRRRKYAH